MPSKLMGQRFGHRGAVLFERDTKHHHGEEEKDDEEVRIWFSGAGNWVEGLQTVYSATAVVVAYGLQVCRRGTGRAPWPHTSSARIQPHPRSCRSVHA